jgi:hypothetical protein
MKKIIAGVIVALGLLVTPAVSAEVCSIPVVKFLSDNSDNITKLHVYKDDVAQKLLSKVNDYRVSKGGDQLDADTFVVGELKNGNIGIMWVKGECVVLGSVLAVSLEAYRQVMRDFGMEDIVKDIGADV